MWSRRHDGPKEVGGQPDEQGAWGWLRRGRACHSCGARARQRQSTVRIRSGRCGRWRAPLLEVVASAPAVAPAKWRARADGQRRQEAGGRRREAVAWAGVRTAPETPRPMRTPTMAAKVRSERERVAAAHSQLHSQLRSGSSSGCQEAERRWGGAGGGGAGTGSGADGGGRARWRSRWWLRWRLRWRPRWRLRWRPRGRGRAAARVPCAGVRAAPRSFVRACRRRSRLPADLAGGERRCDQRKVRIRRGTRARSVTAARDARARLCRAVSGAAHILECLGAVRVRN